MKNIILSLSVAMCLTLMAGEAFSKSWVNDVTIEDVRWYTRGDHCYITTSISSNPEGCANVSPYRYISADMLGHNKVISMAMAAMMTGKTVSVLLDGCDATNTYNKIIGIIIRKY